VQRRFTETKLLFLSYSTLYLKLREGKYDKPEMGTVRLRILRWEKESIRKVRDWRGSGRFDQEEGNVRLIKTRKQGAILIKSREMRD
jgi:hypothetical protein